MLIRDYKGVRSIRWENNKLSLLDQRQLPEKEIWITYENPFDIVQAIKDMVVRGAPAISISAAYAVAQWAYQNSNLPLNEFNVHLSKICNELKHSRPTAINLAWALDKINLCTVHFKTVLEKVSAILHTAEWIDQDDLERCKLMGQLGAQLIPNNSSILTICNAGALATAGFGTALSVIRHAHYQKKNISVLASETRPYLQGARLTTWELHKEDIPVSLITDNMAGHFMKTGEVNVVITGADRITVNGDTANKIGTYSLAVLAKYHRLPFYVIAPESTFDLTCLTGKNIPIEERSSLEVTSIKGVNICSQGVIAKHPAFDVTPHELITAIITEKKVYYPPYQFV